MANSMNFFEKSVIFITGASRGIGRTIAIEISRILNPDSFMILIASSESGLNETKSLIHKINNSLKIIVYPIDLSDPSDQVYSNLFDEMLEKIDTKNLETALFIHNAGTIGILKKSTDITDVNVWKKYYDLNFISTVALNGKFVSKFKNHAKLTIVNITSLCGRTPFVNLSMYGSVKAARELYFKVFAVEEPNISVLNYSPGPVNTDMFDDIVKNAEDDGFRNSMKKVKETNILTPKQTVDLLLSVLKKGDFKSGDTVDYFDRVQA